MNAGENFKDLIRKLTEISDEEFEAAKPFFKETVLKKGDFFIREGKVCQHLAYVNKGILRTFYLDEKGEEITYCFCTDNHLETSFKSFILQQPSALSIHALEDSELLVIEYDDLQQLYSNSKVWEKIGRLFSEKEYLKMEEQASARTKETAREKYLRLLEEHPLIIRKSPLTYISSYLGMTTRHLSRLRKELISGHLSAEK